MGVSKNAVVGKAHRLNLPARPSPIRRDLEGATARPAAPLQRRPPMPRQPQPMRRLEQPPAPQPAAPPVQVAQPAPPPPVVVRSFPRMSNRSCCWPLGEPGTAGFRFCSDGALPGKPYCSGHASVAYVKARDRREDAA